MDNEEALFYPPPHTVDQITHLLEIYPEFFGVCTFCGAAGHIDQLVEIRDHLITVCDDCLQLPEVKRLQEENNG